MQELAQPVTAESVAERTSESIVARLRRIVMGTPWRHIGGSPGIEQTGRACLGERDEALESGLAARRAPVGRAEAISGRIRCPGIAPLLSYRTFYLCPSAAVNVDRLINIKTRFKRNNRPAVLAF
jgi:hypothetical protein